MATILMKSSAAHTAHFAWQEFSNPEFLQSGLAAVRCGFSIDELLVQIRALVKKVAELEAINAELKARLGLNSKNSSKPPSSDGYKKPKPKNRRVRSGKKPGGQKGHRGSNMKIPHEPDEVQKHLPEKCQNCPHLGECQQNDNFSCAESRFVVDVTITTKVTEHQTLKPTMCPYEQSDLTADFPDDVKAHVQYGDSVTALAVLLNTYGAVSYDRIKEILNSLAGTSISTGTIVSMLKRCSEKVEPALQEVKEQLKQNDVNHFDETGIRVNGTTQWVHNSSSADSTYQTVHEKRGQAGIDHNGVLVGYTGTAVHDCWGPYWKYPDATHAVCGAHLLRELEGIQEMYPSHTWAGEFASLLIRMKHQKEKDLENGKDRASPYHLHKFSREYDRIIKLANSECPPPPKPTEAKRGRQKKGKERCLIERLIDYRGEVTLFFRNYASPFDNNQAERDQRNCKTKIKVSGCFRSKEGAQGYLNISSFLSTAKKRGINAFNAIKSALAGAAKKIVEVVSPASQA